MSPLLLVAIGAVGGIGALGRFLLDGWVGSRSASSLPLGTLAVNLTGAFSLGVIAGVTSDETVMHLTATGLFGAYTTFSTWAFESERLAEDGRLGMAAANFGVSLVLGVSLAWLGLRIGGWL